MIIHLVQLVLHGQCKENLKTDELAWAERVNSDTNCDWCVPQAVDTLVPSWLADQST